MEISEIINGARLKRRITMGVVESKTGILAANQSKIELGNNKKPGFDTIAKLASYYKLDLNEVYKATQSGLSDSLTIANTEIPIRIPVLKIADVEQWVNGDRSVINSDTQIKISPEPCSEQSYCLIISDDSMTSSSGAIDSFPIGTTLVIDPKVNFNHNSFVIVKLKESSTMLFRQAVYIGDEWYFKCVNTQYQILTTSQEFEILGVLIAVTRKIF